MQRGPLIMGILNVTPDSFYDPSTRVLRQAQGARSGQAPERPLHQDPDAAVEWALEMVEKGADIIDIGGESTGPGSAPISVEEELGRVMPVIRGVRCPHFAEAARGRQVSGVRISVDTYKAEVAQRAIESGADMINDVSAGRADPGMFNVIAKAGCRYVLMHNKGAMPHVSMECVQYDDVVRTIYTFFTHRIAAAEAAGIRRDQIILDPGLGHFVSGDPKYSWEILERLEEFRPFGCPILVSPSRKSFTADRPDQPPSQRLEGTLRATRVALEHGAGIIRTHDVRETGEVAGARC